MRHTFTIQEIINMSILVDIRNFQSDPDKLFTKDLCSDGEFILCVDNCNYLIKEGEMSVFATRIGGIEELIYNVGPANTGLIVEEIDFIMPILNKMFPSVTFIESDEINSVYMEKCTPIYAYLDSLIHRLIF